MGRKDLCKLWFEQNGRLPRVLVHNPEGKLRLFFDSLRDCDLEILPQTITEQEIQAWFVDSDADVVISSVELALSVPFRNIRTQADIVLLHSFLFQLE